MTSVSMKAPVCLIENTAKNELQVNQEALTLLQAIKQPLVVVAIVGLYRTGKSFLMNKLAGSHTGFPLGSTIQSQTKGVWMWCVPHPNKSGHTLVLLDTEGLGDVEKGDQKNDTWLFVLAVLLSSTLVYNSMGTINNDAVQNLHYVTEMSNYIKVKSDTQATDDPKELADLFPTFVWAVRDFSLELILNGETISPDDYLENSLIEKPDKNEAYNQPRECIRNYFPVRKCFVFERPASGSKMRRMEQLSDRDLDPEFVTQSKEFCQYIHDNNCRVKIIKGGITVTGQMLGNLIQIYVDTIRSGNVPCLDNAIQALAQIENTSAVQNALSHYKSKMKKNLLFHVDTEKKLSDLHGQCEKEAVTIFLNRSFKDDNQTFQRKLAASIQVEYESFCVKQGEGSEQHCKSLLQKLSRDLEAAVKEGIYMRSGGYQQYKDDLQRIVKQYEESPQKGMKAEDVLLKFLKERDELGNSILKTDNTLTGQQRQIQIEQLKIESMRREAKAAQELQNTLQLKVYDQERTHQENMAQYMAKVEQEHRIALEENKRLLEAKVKEQRDLIDQGFRQREDELNRQIQQLRNFTPPPPPQCVVM
ncbi:guanylate-binding protein 1-like [Erpetoichthys calabaricus]|uniref:guanylate-binding protein 1-like n=1 Tax=Erpetoichthys calabaricus TaxID=27687 RepID=UPI00223425E6|nr:guanylate-binding protein 1-like [Erpetoichthys calabaricus]